MKRMVGAAIVVLSSLAAADVSVAMGNRPLRETQTLGGGGGGTIQGGTMSIQVVNGCYALITGSVQTPNTGGSVSAVINFWDDGTFLGSEPLSFPADGGTSSYCHVYQQTVPVAQEFQGIGVYLEDAVEMAASRTFASSDNLNISDICTGGAPICRGSSALDVPAVNRTGFFVLALLLAGAAVYGLARRRAAAP